MLKLCSFHNWENTSNLKKGKHPSYWHHQWSECLCPDAGHYLTHFSEFSQLTPTNLFAATCQFVHGPCCYNCNSTLIGWISVQNCNSTLIGWISAQNCNSKLIGWISVQKCGQWVIPWLLCAILALIALVSGPNSTWLCLVQFMPVTSSCY